MTARKIMFSGHAIDRDKNVMELALFRNLDGGSHPYVFEVNRVPWTMSLDEASRLAHGARMVARAFELPRRDGRRLAEATAFDASPPGPDGSAWPIALGIEDRGDDSLMFFTFGLDCVRFPAGEGADALLNVFAILADDLGEVQRATARSQPQQQLFVSPERLRSPHLPPTEPTGWCDDL